MHYDMTFIPVRPCGCGLWVGPLGVALWVPTRVVVLVWVCTVAGGSLLHRGRLGVDHRVGKGSSLVLGQDAMSLWRQK